MILILLLILNNSSVGHTRAELESKPTAIPCQNHAILSVDYKLSIILGRRRPDNDAVETGRCLQTKLVENMHIASKAGRSNISADY